MRVVQLLHEHPQPRQAALLVFTSKRDELAPVVCFVRRHDSLAEVAFEGEDVGEQARQDESLVGGEVRDAVGDGRGGHDGEI